MTIREEAQLDDLLECESGLSSWEMDFIEDADNKRELTLTYRQSDKPSQIWEKLCNG